MNKEKYFRLNIIAAIVVRFRENVYNQQCNKRRK